MNKNWIVVIILVVLVLLGWFVWPGWGKNMNPSSSPSPGVSPSALVSPSMSSEPSASTTISPNPDGTISFFGELRESDNVLRGNLLLVNSNSKIYLRTGRDFSKLIGQQVEITVNGSLEVFTLVNIKTK